MAHLIDAKTAKGQAGQMLRAIRREARSVGMDAGEAVLRSYHLEGRGAVGRWSGKVARLSGGLSAA